VNFDGADRRMILNSGLVHIFSLVVFEDMIYWSDWGSKKILKAPKLSGTNTTDGVVTIATLVHSPMGKYEQNAFCGAGHRCEYELTFTLTPPSPTSLRLRRSIK